MAKLPNDLSIWRQSFGHLLDQPAEWKGHTAQGNDNTERAGGGWLGHAREAIEDAS
jgi:hypothetical protein